MKGSHFRFLADEFAHVDEFLSSVTATVGESYEFPSHEAICEETLLGALGFEFVRFNWNKNPIYTFFGTPSDPPARIVVPFATKVSDQWIILSKSGISTWLHWKGPRESSIEETVLPHTFLSAQEAREITDKALQTTKTLKDVLQKVHNAAEAGEYSIIASNCSVAVQKRLADLGFKVTESEISWE